MKKILYAAYGSNLNLKQMQFRCKDAIRVGSVLLDDYRLAYKGAKDNKAYLTIEKASGYSVPLGIYEISMYDEMSLNKYEGYPRVYYKDYLKININGKEEYVMIYIMNELYTYHLPSEEYVLRCNRGYEDFGFDKTVLAEAYQYSEDKKEKGR